MLKDYHTLAPFIKARMEQLHIPGLVIGIVRNGELHYAEGFGYADVENAEPMSAEHVIRVGSISKTFTAIGIMQLIEHGKLFLQAKVNDLLPEGKFVFKDNGNPSPLTIEHLLMHTSGIGELLKKSDAFKFPSLVNQNAEKLITLSDLYAREVKLRIPPGEKWSYANFGYNLLGYIIEVVSGKSFAAYMREHIFNPLGMEITDFEWTKEIRKEQAKGYKYKKGRFQEHGTGTQILMPAGSLYTNIYDMAKYMRCLLNYGTFDGQRILSEDSIRSMWEPHFQIDERLQAMGYTFWIYDVAGLKVLNHGGSLNGYLSQMYLIPEKNFGIMVVINQMTLSNMGPIRIAAEILHKVIDVPDPKEKLVGLQQKFTAREAKRYTGRYGPAPPKDFLTNFRFYMGGGEIKVYQKEGNLMFKQMWGGKKKGVRLWRAEQSDPLHFKLLEKLNYGTVEPYETVIFNQGETGEIISLSKGFRTYVKKSKYRTFFFKFYRFSSRKPCPLGHG